MPSVRFSSVQDFGDPPPSPPHQGSNSCTNQLPHKLSDHELHRKCGVPCKQMHLGFFAESLLPCTEASQMGLELQCLIGELACIAVLRQSSSRPHIEHTVDTTPLHMQALIWIHEPSGHVLPILFYSDGAELERNGRTFHPLLMFIGSFTLEQMRS